jgi:hypothetical protein
VIASSSQTFSALPLEYPVSAAAVSAAAPSACLARLCHRVELAAVVAVVDHLAGDNQLVLVVHRDLHVIPGHDLPVLREQSSIGVGARQLAVATVREFCQISRCRRASLA